MEYKSCFIKLPKDLYRKVKIRALDAELSMSVVIEQAIKEYFFKKTEEK